MRKHAWIIAAYGAALSTWVAWVGWRRDHSRFRVTVQHPPSYTEEPTIVTAVYRGGPPVRIVQSRARVLRIKSYSWLESFPEKTPDNPDTSVLRPEHREVSFSIPHEYVDRVWYVSVEAEGGIRKRKFLQVVPHVWRKSIEVAPFWAAQRGLVVGSHKPLERALKAAAKEFQKQSKRDNDQT